MSRMRKNDTLILGLVLLVSLVLAPGCKTTPDAPVGTKVDQGSKAAGDVTRGVLTVDIANILEEALMARVDLLDKDNTVVESIPADKQVVTVSVPVGTWRAFVYIYDFGVPILAEVQDVTVAEGRKAELHVRMLEGTGGRLRLRDFDYDYDLAIDRVELACGTNKEDTAEIPGKNPIPFVSTTLNSEGRWYRGELHAHSKYGRGKESVKALITRAEESGMEFLAITDRNTLDSIYDPAYQSSKLALIPAMEWGNDDMGVALIYGPRTYPDLASSYMTAQAECIRVQQQGGLFMIAHPCYPTAPWRWGLGYVNGIEVWFRDWRSVPPLLIDALDDSMKVKDGGRYVHSLAYASATATTRLAQLGSSVSANEQAELFYDLELVRGLTAVAIGGSNTASKKVPMGQPTTWVYAEELSSQAILDGLRQGRTYVTADPSGPRIAFNADVLRDGKVDVSIGGVIPLGLEAFLIAGVKGAVGHKLQILENGRPILSQIIDQENYGVQWPIKTNGRAAYRMRIIAKVPEGDPGFGPLKVLAMSSPIYARDIARKLLWRDPEHDPSKTWIRIDQTPATPEMHFNDQNRPVAVW